MSSGPGRLMFETTDDGTLDSREVDSDEEKDEEEKDAVVETLFTCVTTDISPNERSIHSSVNFIHEKWFPDL